MGKTYSMMESIAAQGQDIAPLQEDNALQGEYYNVSLKGHPSAARGDDDTQPNAHSAYSPLTTRQILCLLSL